MHSPTRLVHLLLSLSAVTAFNSCTQIVVSQETAVSTPSTATEATDIGSTETQEATDLNADVDTTVGTPNPTASASANVTAPVIQPVIDPANSQPRVDNPDSALPSPNVAVNNNGGLDPKDLQRLQDFQNRFTVQAKAPKDAIRLLFIALLELEKNPRLAEYMVTVVYNGKKMTADASSPTGFSLGSSDRFILNQMRQRPEIVHSYLGGTPDKNYMNFDATANTIEFPPNGAVINGIRVNNTLEGNAEGQIYIKSKGKDLPTPIRMERNNQGLFKVDPSSVSSVATGVRQAEPENF